MSGHASDRERRRYLPDILDMERLFAGPRLLGFSGIKQPSGNIKDQPNSERIKALREQAGFPFGSKILIAGEAGSGKTTLALAMVRNLIVQWSERFNPKDPTSTNVAPQSQFDKRIAWHFQPDWSAEQPQTDRAWQAEDHELCYVSTEVNHDRLKQLFAQYGWFEEEDPLFGTNRVDLGRRVVIPTIREIKVRRPLQGSVEIVNLVLNQVKDAYVGQRHDGAVFVVVDSLTAVLKDSRDPGERRRDALEFLDRLVEAIRPKRIALAFLIAERPPNPDPVTYADEVAADFVFRLGLTRTSPGRWLRTLAVTKSAGVNMAIGEHTWAVLTSNGLDDVIAQSAVKSWVKQSASREGLKTSSGRDTCEWATVGVFPKPQLAPIGKLNGPDENNAETPEDRPKEPEENNVKGLEDCSNDAGELKAAEASLAVPTLGNMGERRVKTGTVGLDELLEGDVDYWIGGVARKTVKALDPGSTTLFVGTTGTGKSTICLQFLAAEKDKSQTLYVNFETSVEDTRRGYQHVESFNRLFGEWNALYRRRANLDLNLLLTEIRFVMLHRNVRRVALDGLSDLLATTDQANYARLVEAVLGTIRETNSDAITFVTLEFDPRQLETELPAVKGLSATADNVVVLRQVLINDQFRKTAYVLKARGMNSDAQVREVRITADPRGPLRIGSGLESYSNLLSDRPTPVRIDLQLFAENAAERKVNSWLKRRLKRLFGYDVRTFGFSRPAMTRTINDAISPTGRIPHSDVKVVSLDEWWVREYGVPTQQPVRPEDLPEHPLLPVGALFDSPQFDAVARKRPWNLAENEALGSPDGMSTAEDVRGVPRYRSSPAQFWVFEIEKASALLPRSNPPRSDLLAVPNYTDFAMFCVNPGVLAMLTGSSGALAHAVSAVKESPSSTLRVAEHNANADSKGATPEGSTLNQQWNQLLDLIPRTWVRREKLSPFGFAAPKVDSPSVVVDWMKAAANQGMLGFAFDMETTETSVCIFLELCWGFGATEDFLLSGPLACADVSQQNWNKVPAFTATCDALRFLQYMVYHGLMRSWPKLVDAERALFSRQWYSTIGELAEQLDRTKRAQHPDPPGRVAAARVGQGSVDRSNLAASAGQRWASSILPDGPIFGLPLPLPFFPVGPDGENHVSLLAAVLDARTRFRQLIRRVLAAVLYRSGDNAEDPSIDGRIGAIYKRYVEAEWSPPSNPDDLRKFAEQLELDGEELKRAAIAYAPLGRGWIPGAEPSKAFNDGKRAGCSYKLRDPHLILPAARTLNLRDVLELLDWHRLRIRLLLGELNKQPLSQAIRETAVSRKPAAKKIATKPSANDISARSGGSAPAIALTGYSCSGSWMLGVGRRTHSPLLSWKFVEEMTSLDAAVKRSLTGAGIPVRKDFFDAYGDRPVLNAPHLTWNDLLRFGGARARRRDRALCPGIQATTIFDLIHRRIIQCLTVAHDARKTKGADKASLDLTAVNAATDIFAEVTRLMRLMGQGAGENCPPTCGACPRRGQCAQFINPEQLAAT